MPINERELLGALSFDCVSKEKKWQPIDMYILNPKKEKGDFYSLGGIGTLIFDEKTLDIMLTVFEMAGEILPVKLESQTLYALNILECTNALDEKNTKWDLYENGDRGRILNYSFHKNRFPESSLFKIPETSKTEIFTFSGMKDSADEFYSLYIQHDLKGLIFEDIYNL